MNTFFDHFHTPIGNIDIVTNEDGALIEIWIRDARHPIALEQNLERERYDLSRDDQRTGSARRQLLEYFAGERRTFDLPLVAGGSQVQKAVWRELAFIPFGETVSYGELADAIGMPGEAQAVGAACAANPLLLVVPCHRVIASDGSLRGYAAGLHIKEQLLAFEKGQQLLPV